MIYKYYLCYMFLFFRCDIIRGGMKEYLTPMGPTPLHVNPIFEIGPVEPRFSEWLVFEGISVDESGRQHFLDATVAYKRAVLNAIDYLHKFGYSKEQVWYFLRLPLVVRELTQAKSQTPFSHKKLNNNGSAIRLLKIRCVKFRLICCYRAAHVKEESLGLLIRLMLWLPWQFPLPFSTRYLPFFLL